MIKFCFKWKNIGAILVVIGMTPLMVNIMPQLGPAYADLPDNTKHFVTAILAGTIGLVLLSMKKKLDQEIRTIKQQSDKLSSEQVQKISRNRELSLSAELYEIFLFLMLPAIAFFGIIPEDIKEHPMYIVVIFLPIVACWFIVSHWLITKSYKIGEGKIVKTQTDTFFGYMMFIGIMFFVMIWYLESLIPK